MATINVNQTNASETAKGIVEEATQAETNAGTATGGTGAKLFVTPAKLISLLASYLTTAAAALLYTPLTRTISTTSPLSGGGDLSANRTLTTSMATNKLIGRGTAGTGVMEEITLGTGLSLSGTTLNAATSNNAPRVVTAAGAVTITTSDLNTVVVVNKTVGAATTVNLPATPTAGDLYRIKDGKGDCNINNITIDGNTTDTIDGSLTLILSIPYQAVDVVWNGTQWNAI